MRLLFLGTGAAEEVPSVWCACAKCRRIRELGGRNRRRNACAFLEPDVVIDHPPTLTSQAWDAGVDLSAVRHLVFTHGHMDHFYPHLFRWRLGDGREEPQGGAPVVPRYGQLPLLFVYGSEKLLDDVAASLRGSTPEALRMALCPVRAGQSFAVGSYRFTAIPANHPVPGDVAFNYLIEDQAGRALLYGLDGGTPPEEAWELLEGRQLDAVILDATTGFTGHGAASNHMSLHDVREVVARLRKIGALAPGSRVVLSHINAHHWPPHDEAAPRVEREGMVLSYDGMWLEL